LARSEITRPFGRVERSGSASTPLGSPRERGSQRSLEDAGCLPAVEAIGGDLLGRGVDEVVGDGSQPGRRQIGPEHALALASPDEILDPTDLGQMLIAQVETD
jgi:hypothetical protein